MLAGNSVRTSVVVQCVKPLLAKLASPVGAPFQVLPAPLGIWLPSGISGKTAEDGHFPPSWDTQMEFNASWLYPGPALIVVNI